jgi:hypothetical protein
MQFSSRVPMTNVSAKTAAKSKTPCGNCVKNAAPQQDELTYRILSVATAS